MRLLRQQLAVVSRATLSARPRQSLQTAPPLAVALVVALVEQAAQAVAPGQVGRVAVASDSGMPMDPTAQSVAPRTTCARTAPRWCATGELLEVYHVRGVGTAKWSHTMLGGGRCNRKGHMSSVCPLGLKTCNNCGKPGHMIRNCPSVRCNLCHKRGHLMDNCPSAQGKAAKHHHP